MIQFGFGSTENSFSMHFWPFLQCAQSHCTVHSAHRQQNIMPCNTGECNINGAKGANEQDIGGESLQFVNMWSEKQRNGLVHGGCGARNLGRREFFHSNYA